MLINISGKSQKRCYLLYYLALVREGSVMFDTKKETQLLTKTTMCLNNNPGTDYMFIVTTT